MRAPSDMPRSGGRARGGQGRGRVALVVAAVVAFVLFTSARGIADFFTDYLWFDSLGRTDVWGGVLVARITLAAFFSGLFFAILLVNLWVADKIAPTFRPSGPDDELLRRYQDVMSRRAWLVRVLVAGGTGLLAGVSMATHWEPWLLFRNGSTVGSVDAEFGMDLGFYLFQLPFIGIAIDWLFASLIIILFITGVAHYLNGGIRLQSPIERVTPQVKAHLSVLIGLLALTKAVDYWFDRYELVQSTRGAVRGATYTDVNAQLPAIYLLTIIALLSFVLFLVNIRRRGWVLPLVAVGLWAFVAIVAGAAYPAFIQRFQVEPARSEREAEFVQRNIDGTRAAFGLDEVNTLPFEGYTTSVEAGREAVLANADTIRNVPLLDSSQVLQTFRRLQATREFYRILGLEVDRYQIETPDGERDTTPVVVGTRELNLDGIPDRSWENQHLVYTHGYGMALAPSNVTTSNGQPDFLIRGFPVDVDTGAIDVELDRPEIYVGQDMGGFAVVNTNRDEVNFVNDDGSIQTTRYEGREGVEVGSLPRRAAFAIRFADWNLMVSGLVNSDSKMIFRRDVRERVEFVAPFLSVDAETYPVVADGRIFYIVDAYTTSDHYPYSQTADTRGLDSASGLNHRFNYVRNSVKAVVDAYDGTVALYVMGEPDPIIDAWRATFPDLFADVSEMSAELRAHIRYPMDLFQVQTAMWGRYHIDDPREFLESSNEWSVAPAAPSTAEALPGGLAAAPPTTQAGQTLIPTQNNPNGGARSSRINPYYQILQLPDDPRPTFMQIRTYVPVSERETDSSGSQLLTAFMVANSDPDGDYGKLTVYEMQGLTVDGPRQMAARVQANDTIAREISLLQGRGSEVSFGDMMMLPLDNTIMYVWPMYVASQQAQVPELRFVIGVHGERIVMERTLREVIDRLFEVDVTTFEREGGPEEDPSLVGDIDEDRPIGADPEDPDATTTTTTSTTTTTTTVPPPATDGEPPADMAELVARVTALLEQAEAALREDGDMAEYQRLVREAQALLAGSGQLAATPAGADGDGPSG
ncbi:MAG: UPF0182 family protein [Acidimicrobiia bacterium]|nr:UPF0182 family protein [Acidimicrobiia bacterium]